MAWLWYLDSCNQRRQLLGTKSYPDAGFAQIVVLVGLASLSGLLVVALSEAKQTGRYSQALDRQIAGSWVARSGVERIIQSIEDPADDLDTRLLSSDMPYETSILGVETTLQIQAEAGKLNPATADARLLEGYFDDVGIGPDVKAKLLSELAPLRADGDSAAAVWTVHSYLLPYVGMEQLERDFGIWNTTAGIDPRYASKDVLASVPGLSQGDAERFRSDPTADLGLAGTGSSYLTRGRPVFCVSATAHWTADSVASYGEAIEITSGGRVLALRHSCDH